MAGSLNKLKFVGRVLGKRRSPIRQCIMKMTSVPAEEKTVEIEKMDKLFLIAINRPHKRNAVNPATAKLLLEAFKEFEKDDDALVAILHGKGGNFCAGYDLGELATSDGSQISVNLDEIGEGPMGPSRMWFTKPVIAAVSGYAVAGGLELALMCDLRVVEETAVMGVFCRRFGVPLLDGGTVRLPQLIGLSRALDMTLTGRAVNAREAHEFGLANQVVATGTALGQAILLANSIAKFPQTCMRADRDSAYNSCFNAKSMKEAFQYELTNGLRVIQQESIPGAQRFASGIGRHGTFNLNKKESKL